jgi:uncharacterized radical SAM protein YgiQ
MFIPTTKEELIAKGITQPDVILVTGDTYIDSPHVGVAVVGKWLMAHGYTVAIIAQPNNDEIARLGEPKLFWGVTGGCIDSMVANYTPLKKFRNQDDYTPGGVNMRPPRATIAYTNLIRQHFKNTVPVVLGGLEASLRRVAHYDFWDDSIRRSILLDAKADALVYGMGEKAILALAEAMRRGTDWHTVPGMCYISPTKVEGFEELPSFETVSTNKVAFRTMFEQFYKSIDITDYGMQQQHGARWLIHNPAQPLMSTAELDEVYAMDFERDVHPFYKANGEVRALETIKQSITTHRGCYGQCNFCAIAVHQGRRVVSRSIESILAEATRITHLKGFNGIIYDVGGATANMYGSQCHKGGAPCVNRHCLLPHMCPNLSFGHQQQLSLLQQLLQLPGIKKVFISSGIRHDIVDADKKWGPAYIAQLVGHHVSGQIKLAPEHYDNDVLSLMGKPSIKALMRFKTTFDEECRKQNKNYFMTYYLMAAHPGCTMNHMERLRDFLKGGLKIMPEQVQIFTPTPSTRSTLMYYCGTDLAGNPIPIEKSVNGKQRQKDAIRLPSPAYHHEQRGHGARGQDPRAFRAAARKESRANAPRRFGSNKTAPSSFGPRQHPGAKPFHKKPR